MPDSDIDKFAKIVWEYLKIDMPLKKCEVILTLCSIDTRVAEYAAELFLKGMGNYLIFSGGIAHYDDLLRVNWQGPEADHFAEIAIQKGVPKDNILIENTSENTSQNIVFTHQLLSDLDLIPNTMLLVQKPYMLRRTYATFKKQWPETDTEIIVSAPPISYEDYFNDENPKNLVINVMVGDLQRIKDYPAKGFQIPQEIPEDVLSAYRELVKLGYTKHLLD